MEGNGGQMLRENTTKKTKEFAEKEKEGNLITLHLFDNYDKNYAPIKAEKTREWLDDFHVDDKTYNHAKFCLPLTMGTSAGYYILSPATFTIEWDGNNRKDSLVNIHEDACSHAIIDAHSTRGGFTVQAMFVPRTKNPGDFIYIKGIPNQYRKPYYVLEAMIEAWWNPAHFGIVCMLNQPGKFTIEKGEPIAQMLLVKASGLNADLELTSELAPHHKEFLEKRSKAVGRELDYMRGLLPDGTEACPHFKHWYHKVNDKNDEIEPA